MNKKKNDNCDELNLLTNPILVSCRESIIENKRSFYGRFYIGPLEIGQGITLANALRRVLLSELKGLAITSVEIEGVSHEYSNILGVRESVLDILLNLKQIVLKTKISLKRPQVAYIHCKGPGVLRASDILLPSFIQCVDPEQYITTLSYNGVLKMKLIIRQGKNYLVQKPTVTFSNSSSDQVKKINYFNFSDKLDLPNISDKIIYKNSKHITLKEKNILLKHTFTNLKSSKIVSLEILKSFFKTKKFSRTKISALFFKTDFKKLQSIRSIRQIFQNSKNKSWFIYLLKKQLISLVNINSVDTFKKTLVENVNNKSYFIKGSSLTKPLALDSIFMPVTKVNYILEENSQKLFGEFIQNDFLLQINQLNQESNKSSFSFKSISNNAKLGISDNFKNSFLNKNQEVLIKEIKKNNFKNYWLLFSDEFLDSNTNFPALFKSAHYFEKFNKSPKEIIILEIWTNGSILPRLALINATKQLLGLFIRFQKSKMMKSSFFKTNINYTETINNLSQHYDYFNSNFLYKSTNRLFK
uniref:DNA-directed RNA polymerase n=1 Tax=Aphanochaete elegans TaxID=764105 RepID=A0A6H1XDQ2_9CHLO|nr:alpha subunit of RNA polymerase [Aphanochaete elegans]QJA13749.1 alpha subunit of RNA polymerase [Aphanochaete elegans]